jgi:hypothetical protein
VRKRPAAVFAFDNKAVDNNITTPDLFQIKRQSLSALSTFFLTEATLAAVQLKARSVYEENRTFIRFRSMCRS